MSDSLRPQWLQHTRPPCPSPTPGVYSNSCPLSQWCHPTISSSVIPFSRLPSFPASGSFTMSQFFTSGGQSIGEGVWWKPMTQKKKKKKKPHIWLILIIYGSILVNLPTCWNVLLISKSINAHMLSWSLTDMQSGRNWYPDVHAPSWGWTKWHSLCLPVPALTP